MGVSEDQLGDIFVDRSAIARNRVAVSENMVSSLAVLLDFSLMMLSSLAIVAIYIGYVPEKVPLYLGTTAIFSLITIQSFYFAKLYRFSAITQPEKAGQAIVALSLLVFAIFVISAFSLKISASYSRVWVFSWFGLNILLLYTGRLCYRRFLHRWALVGRLSRQMAVVGSGEQARRLIRHLGEKGGPFIRVLGVFDDRNYDRTGKSIEGVPVLGRIDSVVNAVRKGEIDEVVIALPWSADVRIRQIVEALSDLPVNIRVCTDLVGFNFPGHRLSMLSDVVALDVSLKPIDGWRFIAKRIEDILLSAAMLAVLSPLLLAIAVAVKLTSKGPVLFRQQRLGFNNQIFTVFKFRSMSVEASSACSHAGQDVPQATKNDPRVTWIGQYLRSWSLDELPQLLNVLNGTMSLVGPRPHAVAHNEIYSKMIHRYYARHRVKPGITGWAQINGYRGETETTEKMEQRIEFDIAYIDNWSILFDLEILIKTPFAVLSRTNAH